LYFFFQAEDGIRDRNVTGVQTCALPIYTKEIVELAETDKDAASDRLFTYMEKEWFQGHYDYGWKNAHKEPDYVGFWSFESAALAKILGLDDAGLQDNNHYPYDLAH